MPRPEGSQLNQNVNPILTNMAIGFLPDAEKPSSAGGLGYVGRGVFPSLPVASPSGMYNVWKRGDFLRRGGKKIANGEAPPVEGFATGSGNYSVDSWGVSTAYTARDLAEGRRAGISEGTLRTNKTKFVTLKGMLELELKVATFCQTSGNWTNTVAGVAANPVVGTSFMQWNQAGSQPVEDLIYWKEKMRLTSGFAPNKMVIPIQVWNTMRSNAELLSRITYSGTMDRPTQVSLQQVKDLFEIQNIVIAEGVYNTAVEGQVDAFGYIWGKSIWMGYVTDAPSLDQPSAGYNFAWTGDATAGLPAGVDGLGNEGPAQFGSTLSPEGLFIRTYDTVRPAMRYIDAEMYTQPNVTAADLGMTFTAVVP